MKNVSKISKEKLEELYITQQLSTRDIAKQLNVGQTTVRRLLKKYNIKARTQKEGKQTDTYKKKVEQLAKRYEKEYKELSIASGNRIIKTCPVCNKTFECLKSQEKTYCSSQCAGKTRQKQKYCQKCHTNIVNRGAKYCKECYPTVVKERGINSQKRIKTVCGYCGKELMVIPSILKNREKIYCDVNCMAADYKERFSGKNSPSYKNGKRHYEGHWLSQRLLVLQRDGGICQRCGKTPEKQGGISMSVHHICNYHNFDDKEEANQMDNLISLCHACHTYVHSNANINKEYIKDKI